MGSNVRTILIVSVVFLPFSYVSAAASFSDSFSNTLDTSRWTQKGDVSVASGVSMTGDSVWGDNGITSVQNFNRNNGDISIETDVTSGNCSSGETPVGIGYGEASFAKTSVFKETYIVAHNGGVLRLFYFSSNGMESTSTSFTCTNDVPFHIRLVVLKSGGARLFVNSSTVPDAVVYGGSFTGQPVYLGTYSPLSTVTYRNFLLTYNTDTEPVVQTPTISSLSPSTGMLGSEVTITGTNFTPTGNTINLKAGAGNSATFPDSVYPSHISSSGNTVVFTIPQGSALACEYTGPRCAPPTYSTQPGAYTISVTNANGTSNDMTFKVVTNQPSSSFLDQILSTGQSLSVGFNGAPALSTVQPYRNKMLEGASLVPLVESGVESMSSAMANFISANSSNGRDIVVTKNGVSATAYSGLKKGTAPYALGIGQVSTVEQVAHALNQQHRVIALTTIHGESDHLAGSGLGYKNYLVEWQNDYQNDIRAITGQAGIIPLFTDQMSSQTGYGSVVSFIPQAQLEAAEENAGKIYLVTPKYFFTYSDTAHLTNTSYRWLGEYYGKVIKKVAIDQQSWAPLSPNKITRNGNTIYAQFTVPVAPLAFDTALVKARKNYGFEYSDSSSSASIVAVQISSPDTVQITLDKVPTGGTQMLGYAYSGVAYAQPGAQNSGAVGGNLRDSDQTPSQYGNTLYNWAVQFNKPITDVTSSSPAQISPPKSVVNSVLVAPCIAISKNLTKGSRGKDVLTLQSFLSRVYTDFPPRNVTGYFGSLTENTLKRWQSENGIIAYGTPSTTGWGSVGPKTRAVLNVCKN